MTDAATRAQRHLDAVSWLAETIAWQRRFAQLVAEHQRKA